jgi:hypothetical protein
MKATCRHCGLFKELKAKQLCRLCYWTPTIRARYPSTSPFAPHGEPTMAELDAMEAEQRKCLPEWWNEAEPRTV